MLVNFEQREDEEDDCDDERPTRDRKKKFGRYGQDMMNKSAHNAESHDS